MRVVTWNCRSGTEAKVVPVIEELNPDLLVMPESSRSPSASHDTLLAKGIPHAWVGSISSKGLGVFAPTSDTIEVTPAADGHGEWSLAVRAEGEAVRIKALAVWTVPCARGEWRSRYISALDGIFRRHERFLADGDAVVAGDFNCSAGSDPEELPRFLDQVRNTYGLTSAYHRWSGEPLGAETSMTHWWRGNPATPFHIDFVLVPESRNIEDVSIGAFDRWGAPDARLRSDHAPLTVDLQP